MSCLTILLGLHGARPAWIEDGTSNLELQLTLAPRNLSNEQGFLVMRSSWALDSSLLGARSTVPYSLQQGRFWALPSGLTSPTNRRLQRWLVEEGPVAQMWRRAAAAVRRPRENPSMVGISLGLLGPPTGPPAFPTSGRVFAQVTKAPRDPKS